MNCYHHLDYNQSINDVKVSMILWNTGRFNVVSFKFVYRYYSWVTRLNIFGRIPVQIFQFKRTCDKNNVLFKY